MAHTLLVLAPLMILVGCQQASTAQTDSALLLPLASNFELDCHSSNTATAAELFCIRTDTRSGDILRVRHLSLPTSNGATGVEPSRAGQFTTVCDATSTDTRSDLYCIRLNTVTGEMLLINLQKVGSMPPTK